LADVSVKIYLQKTSFVTINRDYSSLWISEKVGDPVMLNEAKTSRPRPKLRGRGQDYEVKADAKNNYEKVPSND